MQLYKARKEGRNFQAPTTPAELLAIEEALLDCCEENEHPGFLSFWESASYFVVLGYGKQLAAEVYEDECRELGVPILRRASGGGTVLQGQGCFNYTLVLPIKSRPELESITSTNHYVMGQTRTALAPLIPGTLKIEGYTDLTVDGLKFSGNAQRRKRRSLLFHGSLLLNFDLAMISRTLRLPQQQPDYRKARPHGEFVTNLKINAQVIEAALTRAWNVIEETPAQISAEIYTRARALAQTKYGREDWNRRS